jgi:hypothetical protein
VLKGRRVEYQGINFKKVVNQMGKTENANELDRRLAFLEIELFDNGTCIRGAILITDTETKPYEFRITSPVKANFIQRTLYGATLGDYIYIDLISIPLIKEIRANVDLIIVSSKALLRIRPKISLPIVFISKGALSSSGNNLGDNKLLSFFTHEDYPNEKPVAQAILLPIMQKMDLLEPFDRIKVALTEAHKEKIGESKK